MAEICALHSRQSHSTLPGVLALTIFLRPLLQCSLSLNHRGCVLDISVGSEHPTGSCSLGFDQLWASIMVSICSKKFLRCWVRVALIGLELRPGSLILVRPESQMCHGLIRLAWYTKCMIRAKLKYFLIIIMMKYSVGQHSIFQYFPVLFSSF